MNWIAIGIGGYVVVGALPTGYLALRMVSARALARHEVVTRLQWSAVTGIGLSLLTAGIAFSWSRVWPSWSAGSVFLTLGALELLALVLIAAVMDSMHSRVSSKPSTVLTGGNAATIATPPATASMPISPASVESTMIEPTVNAQGTVPEMRSSVETVPAQSSDTELAYDFKADESEAAEWIKEPLDQKGSDTRTVSQEDLLEAEFQRLKKATAAKPFTQSEGADPKTDVDLDSAPKWKPVRPQNAPDNGPLESIATPLELKNQQAEVERAKRELKKKIQGLDTDPKEE